MSQKALLFRKNSVIVLNYYIFTGAGALKDPDSTVFDGVFSWVKSLMADRVKSSASSLCSINGNMWIICLFSHFSLNSIGLILVMNTHYSSDRCCLNFKRTRLWINSGFGVVIPIIRYKEELSLLYYLSNFNSMFLFLQELKIKCSADSVGGENARS